MPKKTNEKTSKKVTRKTGVAKTTLPRAKAPRKAAPGKAAGPAHILTEGMAAPAFRLPRDDGDSISLKDFTGRNLVLYFYPRADTPGCTLEAADFTRLAPSFEELDTAILGVSADPQAALQRFRKKHALGIGLASDETLAMLKAYGVWGKKSFMGRTFDGILRTTILVDAKGRIARIWRNVKVADHAEAVLASIRGSLS